MPAIVKSPDYPEGYVHIRDGQIFSPTQYAAKYGRADAQRHTPAHTAREMSRLGTQALNTEGGEAKSKTWTDARAQSLANMRAQIKAKGMQSATPRRS